jgi:CxxC motif-containing protein
MPEIRTKIICITCPVGCTLDVTYEDQKVIKVEGNQCRKGIDYAQSEIKDPRRMVTTTVKVIGGLHPLVPVYTSAPIPKPLIFELVKRLREIELQAPVKVGQVILKDFMGTGVDVLAARDMPQAGQKAQTGSG